MGWHPPSTSPIRPPGRPRFLQIKSTAYAVLSDRRKTPVLHQARQGFIAYSGKSRDIMLKTRVGVSISPVPFCELFQIHGSKFKLDPIRDLSVNAQPCVP